MAHPPPGVRNATEMLIACPPETTPPVRGIHFIEAWTQPASWKIWRRKERNERGS